MQRLALGVEYLGFAFSGWQVQAHHTLLPSVQGLLEDALGQMAGHKVSTVCAGRTDAGVHACGQVVHCDVQVDRTEREWVFGCNSRLPAGIRVLWAQRVSDEFDARRSALNRRYRYVVYNSKIRPSLMNEYMAWYFLPLEVGLMHNAAQVWLGEHDFTSFRAAGCQSRSPVRHLQQFSVRRSGELVIFDIVANAFLYHMVRNMVGVLLQIGTGRRGANWAREVLLARDRRSAGVTAPAKGLYFVKAEYAAQWQFPESSADLWFFNQGVAI